MANKAVKTIYELGKMVEITLMAMVWVCGIFTRSYHCGLRANTWGAAKLTQISTGGLRVGIWSVDLSRLVDENESLDNDILPSFVSLALQKRV